jgi:hypothetical protein
MRDDLLDAQAAVDWAVAQLPVLENRIKSWCDDRPYRFIEESHPEMGKKLIKLADVTPLPGLINADVGAIIKSIRSSLDLLASALATRNGVDPPDHVYFPIFDCIVDFIDPKWNHKGKEWCSKSQRTTIESLKPYPGGNDALVALHGLDVLRKHRRLINVRLIPTAIVVTPSGWGQGLGFPARWPGFYDGATIAWIDINATESAFQMPLQITFDETDFLPSRPVVPALRDLASLAESIIKLFDI